MRFDPDQLTGPADGKDATRGPCPAVTSFIRPGSYVDSRYALGDYEWVPERREPQSAGGSLEDSSGGSVRVPRRFEQGFCFLTPEEWRECGPASCVTLARRMYERAARMVARALGSTVGKLIGMALAMGSTGLLLFYLTWEDKSRDMVRAKLDDSPVPAYLGEAAPGSELQAAVCPAMMPAPGPEHEAEMRRWCPAWQPPTPPLAAVLLPLFAPPFDPPPNAPPPAFGAPTPISHADASSGYGEEESEDVPLVLRRPVLLPASEAEEGQGGARPPPHIAPGALIAGNYSSCAVVGSDREALLGRGRGRAINAHSFVIRFNDAPTRGYELDVGKFTSLRIQGEEYCGFAERAGEGCMVSGARGGPRGELRCLQRMTADSSGGAAGQGGPPCTAVHTSPRMHRFAASYWEAAGRTIGQTPHLSERWERYRERDGGCHLYKGTGTTECIQPLSSGLFGLLIALNLCSHVDVYGFSTDPRRHALYYDADPLTRVVAPWLPHGGRHTRNVWSTGQVAKHRMTWTHHWLLEKELLRELHGDRHPETRSYLAFH